MQDIYYKNHQHQANLRKKNQRGSTFIELILYIALLSLFLTGAVLFGWDIVFGAAKAHVQREVNQNIRLATKRIVYETRNASSILSVAPTSVCLASADAARNPTRIYSNAGALRLAWGGGSVNCTSMTNDQPLTSADVSVTSLVFTNRSALPETRNLEYSLTIGSTAARQEWQHSQSVSGAVELRSN